MKAEYLALAARGAWAPQGLPRATRAADTPSPPLVWTIVAPPHHPYASPIVFSVESDRPCGPTPSSLSVSIVSNISVARECIACTRPSSSFRRVFELPLVRCGFSSPPVYREVDE